MRREQRLSKKNDFAAVLNQEKAWANNLLVLKKHTNGLSLSRFGFSVSRRIGVAVIRNRVRRRLREGVHETQVKLGWDVVIIARGGAAKADFYSLKGALANLLRRAWLLTNDSGESLPLDWKRK